MADRGANGEIPSNTTQIASPLMHAQGRQNVLPGYVRRVHAGPYAPGPNAGETCQYQSGQARVSEGVGGVNFGLGPMGTRRFRTDVGSPTQPSELQHGPGRLLMPIPAKAGARTLSIDARWFPDSGVGARPLLIVRRDLDLGIQNDVIVEAGAGGGVGFVTITLNVTLSANGVLEAYRKQQDKRADAWTLWDNLVLA